jgi:hypothetical protein
MILPSDPLVISQPGFRSDFVGWSAPTRSDRTRYRIHRPESLNRSSQVSSKFTVYKFVVFSEILARNCALVFLSTTSRLNTVDTLYLYSPK